MKCYCCSGIELKNCCGSIINGHNARSPEQLMRSRFSAYVMKNYEYILATYHPNPRQQLSIKELEDSVKDIRWLKLNVLEVSENRNLGTVEFIATYYADSNFYRMHEYSFFEKIDEEWLYVKGHHRDKTGKYLPNRNEQCPCGSGKKFKKCCLT